MKDITLNKNGQISLICFFSILIFQPVLILLMKYRVIFFYLDQAISIITLLALGVALVFGIMQFKTTKFALWWVIPTFIYFAFSAFIIFNYSFSKPKIIYPRTKTLYRNNKRKIGVFLDRTREGKIQIIAVLYKSKAAVAGLQGGDIITKINDEIIDKKEIIDVVNLIGSNSDTKLEIERDGKKKIFNIDMTINKNNPDFKL